MQPLEKNLGNIVDKKMGMKPVKDVEKIKKDSDKGGETNKMEKGISLMSLIAKSVRGVQKMNATGEKMKKVSVKENYDTFSAERGNEERAAAAASESHNGLKRGNIVMIDSEVANKLGIEPDSKFEITGFVTYNAGKMLQSTDAILVDVELDENGKIIKRGTNKMDINVEYLEASLNENIFNKNSKITAGTNKIAKGEDNDYVKNYNARAQAADAEQAKKDAEKNKKDTETQLKAINGDSTDAALASFPGLRERLKEMIRKELKETFDGMEPMDRTGLDNE
jgi:paraquat-inducible protein B